MLIFLVTKDQTQQEVEELQHSILFLRYQIEGNYEHHALMYLNALLLLYLKIRQLGFELYFGLFFLF